MERAGGTSRQRAAAKVASRLAAEQLDSSSESSDEDTKAVASARRGKGVRSRKSSKASNPAATSSTSSRKPTSSVAVSSQILPSFQPRRRESLSKASTSSAPVSRTGFPITLPDSDSDIEFLGFNPRPNSQPGPFSGPAAASSAKPTPRGPLPAPLPTMKTPVAKKRVLSLTELSPKSMDSLSPLTSPEDTHRGARGQDEPPSPGMDDWSLDDLGHLVWVRVDQSGRISDDRLKSMWWPAQVTQTSPLQMTLFGRSPLARGDGFDDAKAEVTIDSPSAANVRSMTTTADIMRFNEHNYGGPSSTARSTLFSPKKKQKIAHHDILSRWEDARRLMLKEDQRDQDGLPRFLSFYTPGESEPEDDIAMDLHPEAEPDEIPFVPPPPNFEYDIPGELVLSKDKSKSTQFWPAKILEYVPPKNAKQKPRYKVLFFDHSIRDVTEDMFFSESQEGFGTCKLGESEGNYGLDEEEQDVDEDVDLIPADDDEEALRADTPIPEMPPPKYFEILSIDEQFEYVKPVLSAILQERYEPIRARHDAYMRSAAYRQQVVDQNHDSGQLKGYELEQLGPLIRQWVCRRQARQELGLIPKDVPEADEEPLFYPPPPPSTIGSEPDLGSGIDIFSDDGAVTDPLSEPVPPSSFESAADREERSGPVYSQAGVIEATAGADDDDSGIPQNGRGPTQSDKPPQAPSEARTHTKSFASLTEIDQLTYCSSILLQEAKYQLLLWRHGLRQSFELLSPTEEKRLHEEAEGKATETDWVHTIILSRRVAENSLLPKDRVEPKPLTRLRSGRD